MQKKYSKRPFEKEINQKSSWQKVAPWYEKLVGEKGQYFHKQIILPGVLRLLDFQQGMHLLDLGCGQGILERMIPPGIKYTGIDVSRDLITYAKEHARHLKHVFVAADATVNLDFPDGEFDRVSLILSLQNMSSWEGVFDNISRLLKVGGKAVLVLNHPHFRIPRQTAWGEDEKSKLQYRKVYRYMTQMEVPIEMEPGKSGKKVTWSYHRSFNDLFQLISSRKMAVEALEEWTSDKASQGPKAKMENRARNEIPLFMAIVMTKTV